MRSLLFRFGLRFTSKIILIDLTPKRREESRTIKKSGPQKALRDPEISGDVKRDSRRMIGGRAAVARIATR